MSGVSPTSVPPPVAQPARRRFLDIVLGTSAAAFLASVFYPILAFLRTPPEEEVEVSEVKVGKAADLPLNDSKVFKFGEKAAIAVKMPSGEIRAFEATCTHLACTVQFRPDRGIIWCACHNGMYDLTGRNIAGPPPRPLAPLKVSERNGDLFVGKS
jgi:Rieske Fe-S protein